MLKVDDSVSRPQPQIEKAPAPAAKEVNKPAEAKTTAPAPQSSFDRSQKAAAPVALEVAKPTAADQAVADAAANKPNLFQSLIDGVRAARPAADVADAGGGAGGATGTTGTAATATATPQKPLTPEDQASAQQAIVAASDGRDTSKVTDWLQQHPDKQAAFMDLMFKFGPVAGKILDNTQNLSDAQKQTLADSLNTAFTTGAVTKEEFQNAVDTALYSQTHAGLGDVVGRTHNPELIHTYVEKELKLMNDPRWGEVNGYRAYGAANALAGLPPDKLQEFMESCPTEMKQVMDGLKRDGGYGYTHYEPALGNLLDTASQIQPPTKESLNLFDQSISMIGDNYSARQGAAKFVEKNMDAVLKSYQDDSGSLTLNGQKKLSELFARTMFTEPSFEGQKALSEAVTKKMGDLASSLESQANANPPSIQSQRDARLLGSLIGTVEGGFQTAVDELNAGNAAIDKMVDFMFKASSFIPSLPFPGGGLIKDKTVDVVKDWIKNSLHHNPQDAKDAIPFHESFAEGIDNPALRSYYDSARADAFINRAEGLTK